MKNRSSLAMKQQNTLYGSIKESPLKILKKSGRLKI
jgi:hypothetical protein